MEMRAILANVFRKWDVTCSAPYANHDGPFEMFSQTCGPRDLTPEGLAESAERIKQGQQPTMAMYLHLKPRDVPENAAAAASRL